jgi:phage minor structural protein
MAMNFVFFNAAGQTLFSRSDAETSHWIQHEMTLTADFPFDPNKKIEIGQRIAYRDGDTLNVFEVRQCTETEPDHGQRVTAENIAISELSDEHIDKTEITNKTAAQALSTVLTGTLWALGTNTASGTQSVDIARGDVWQAVNAIKTNWNVYVTPRVTFSAAGAITGRYLDITPAGGIWNGLRLSVRRDFLDPSVTYNDADVYTALYGYGGTVNDAEVTFKNEVWSATSEHPAKPANQTYLEDPAATALYGRNGRARFGYYQNAAITDPSVLLQKTWEALQRCNHPKISISGTAVDLYRLGYKGEPLKLHDLVLVEIAETGETFYKEIIMLDIDLIDPTNNRVDIGDYLPNIIYINRDTAKKSRGGGGGGGVGQTPNEAEQSNTFAEFAKTNDMIGMVVGTRNGGYYVKAGEISLAINQSGEAGSYESTALINADHVNISATSTVHTLAGDLEHDSNGRLVIKNAGGLYVERSSGGTTAQFGIWDRGNLTGGVMVSSINGQSTLKIKADVIDIDGLITLLEAKSVGVGRLTVEGMAYFLGNVDFEANITVENKITCFGFEVDEGAFKVFGNNATWKSQEVVTAVSTTNTHGFQDINGNVYYSSLVNSVSKKTIYYLGR